MSIISIPNKYHNRHESNIMLQIYAYLHKTLSIYKRRKCNQGKNVIERESDNDSTNADKKCKRQDQSNPNAEPAVNQLEAKDERRRLEKEQGKKRGKRKRQKNQQPYHMQKRSPHFQRPMASKKLRVSAYSAFFFDLLQCSSSPINSMTRGKAAAADLTSKKARRVRLARKSAAV